MGYTGSDLALLRPVRDKDSLEGTAYFELHPGEPPEPFACWLEGSLFLKDAGFDFFVRCFEEANPAFDYFAFEPFDAGALDRLDRALASFERTLAPGCSRDLIFSQYSSLFSRNIWDAIDTESMRRAVVCATSEIRTFIQRARSTGQRLWVMGM